MQSSSNVSANIASVCTESVTLLISLKLFSQSAIVRFGRSNSAAISSWVRHDIANGCREVGGVGRGGLVRFRQIRQVCHFGTNFTGLGVVGDCTVMGKRQLCGAPRTSKLTANHCCISCYVIRNPEPLARRLKLAPWQIPRAPETEARTPRLVAVRAVGRYRRPIPGEVRQTEPQGLLGLPAQTGAFRPPARADRRAMNCGSVTARLRASSWASLRSLQ